MKISGIVAIKSVNKGNNNGKPTYSGICVYKNYSNSIEIPFYYPVNNQKQESFLDSYLMVPGKSGLVYGTLQTNEGEFFLYLDSMEFGSLKLDSGYQGGNNYQQQRGNSYQQQVAPAPVYQAPQQTEIKSGLNNFFAKPTNEQQDDIKANTPSSNFWANIGKSGN